MTFEEVYHKHYKELTMQNSVSVTFSCGHTEMMPVPPTIDAESYKKILESDSTLLCYECFLNKTEEKYLNNLMAVRQQSDRVKKINESNSLPKLTGSMKQIHWAESIRAKVFSKANQKIMKKNLTPENVQAVIDTLIKHTSSSWWIDYFRFANADSMINFMLETDDEELTELLEPYRVLMNILPQPETWRGSYFK